jgi:hypothetical protein
VAQAYRTVRAVVLNQDGVSYDNGWQHPLNPAVKLNDLGMVLAGAARALQLGEGVVIIDTPMSTLDMSGMDAWRFTLLRPWTTFTRPDGAVLHVGLLPDLKRHGALLDGSCDGADMAQRLGAYNRLVGVPWRYTAGVSGCAALRAAYANQAKAEDQPLWLYRGPRGMRGAGPLIWESPQQPAGDTRGEVHAFDVNAMFLAAMKNASLAWGRLSPYSGLFDPRYPGWWEIEAADVPAELYDGKTRPPVFPASHIHKGSAVLSTPVVKYLGELGVHPGILTATVSQNPHPVSRRVAETWIKARAELTDRHSDPGDRERLLPSIKATYTETVGMVAREGGSIWRPDWSATWSDLARMNMLRRLDRAAHVGYRPLRVRTDAAYFLCTADHDLSVIADRLGIGTAPGTFKLEKSLTVPEYVALLAGSRR